MGRSASTRSPRIGWTSIVRCKRCWAATATVQSYPRTILRLERTMGGVLVAIGAVGFLALMILSKSFKIIGQAEVMVIERLGRFHRVARSGFNVLIPFVELPRSIDVRYAESDVSGTKRIASRTTTRVDLRE